MLVGATGLEPVTPPCEGDATFGDNLVQPRMNVSPTTYGHPRISRDGREGTEHLLNTSSYRIADHALPFLVPVSAMSAPVAYRVLDATLEAFTWTGGAERCSHLRM